MERKIEKNRNIFLCLRYLIYIFTLLFFLYIPIDFLQRNTFCFFNNYLGFECLSCGLIRAIAYFMQGELFIALQYNKLVLLFLSLFFIIMTSDLIVSYQRYYLKLNTKYSIVERLFFKIYY